uniref:C2H2-type domain-containing protein n=1 Tax=Varanus komodoensis TaxID=61221 RepID=A0A8D2JK38_VARKO
MGRQRSPSRISKEALLLGLPGVAGIVIGDLSCAERVQASNTESGAGALDNSAASVLPTWPPGAAATPPWPTEFQWPSSSGQVAGQEGAPVAFQVGHPCASGGSFWPAGVSAPPPDSHEEMLLICTQCQKCFPAPSARSAPAVAPTGEVTQVCPGCRRRSPAVAPPQSHTGAQPCACTACLSLRFRQRVPREERPFRCGKCEKSFRYVHEYTWHQKVHSGEKNYKCGACEKVFRHKQELMWHQRTHTAEWPHKCGACEKSFRFKQELTWHLKTHSVERPYKSPIMPGSPTPPEQRTRGKPPALPLSRGSLPVARDRRGTVLAILSCFWDQLLG